MTNIQIPTYGLVAIGLVFLIGIGFIIATLVKLQNQLKAEKP